MRLIVLFCCLCFNCPIVFSVNFFQLVKFREKRDDGSYLHNSGGPLAAQSNNAAIKPRQRITGYYSRPRTVSEPCKPKSNETIYEKLHKMYPQAFDKNGNVNKKKAIEEFKKFYVKYNKQKTYLTKQDVVKAVQFFANNFDTLVNLSKTRQSDEDASFMLTKFADLSFELFKSVHTGAIPSMEDVVKADASLAKPSQCKKLSWNDLDVVPHVRQQDKCGACYAMTSADLIGIQYNIDNKMWKTNSDMLSAQYFVDCMPTSASEHCTGGRPVKVLEHLSQCTNCKVPLESCYQYVDKTGECKSINCNNAPPIKIKWGKMYDISGPHEMDLMSSLLQYGPVIAIVSVSQSWQMYEGHGVMRSYQCTEQPNHAVLITGYDYTGCVPYYTVKNTWGTNWGDGGYIKIEAGTNACGIGKMVVVTCTSNDCPSNDHLKYVTSKKNHPSCQ